MLIPLEEWLERYRKIAEFMGYDIERDRRATRTFAGMLSIHGLAPPVPDLHRVLRGRPAMVFGAGPSLDRVMDDLVKEDLIEGFVLLAADGATQALLEREIVPHIVVTDLDGDLGSLLRAAGQGATLIIHAHGDNIDRIRQVFDRVVSVTERIVGTTQVEPVEPVRNFGGFTDGDRCVFLAASFGARPIVMVGMDFGNVVGRRSKPWLSRDVPAWEDKEKKLKIAYGLVSWLVQAFGVPVFTLSTIAPPGVRRINLTQLGSLIGSLR